MKKFYVMSPGPTEVPAELLLESAKPTMHHRTPEFSELFYKVSEDLKPIFKTKNEVYILVSSGTGAMECAVTNLLSKGDKVFVVDGGKFGERWGNIAKAYGLNAHIEKVEWGCAIDPQVVKNYLSQNHDCKAVLTQLSESSTATAHPIKDLAQITRSTNCLLVVDAVSGLGAHPLNTDEWGVDVVVAGSQKALMMPPGLAFICMNDKAWKCAESSNLPKFYFDIKKYKKSLEKKTTPWTMAVNLIYALKWSIDKINKEGGVDALCAHTQKLAHALQAGVKALNLELFSKAPVNGLTAIMVPSGVDGKKLKKLFYERFGITIAGGQEHLEGKIIRISHMGYSAPMDIILALGALEMLLYEMGHKVELGKGVAAAQKILLQK